MARQINFFLHPDDQEDFDKLLKSFGEVILVPHLHHTNNITTVEDTLIRNIKNDKKRIYLVRSVDFKYIELEYIQKFDYWLVKDNGVPVLHFDRSIYTDNKIQRGRLYFEPQILQGSQWVNKSEDFINWADKIIRAARHKLKKYKHQMGNYIYTEYLGANALLWLEETQAEVASAGCELISKIRKRI